MSGSTVNDLLQEAGDNIDAAIAELYGMLTRAVQDGADHQEGRIDDALNLCEQIGGLTTIGRSLAEYVT